MKIYAKVKYLGTRYHGWQKQPDALSVQQEIEKVLSKILNQPISIYASGRTDAGVHALGQVFHFTVEKEVDLAKLKYSVNMLLPSDIVILEFKEIVNDFHARFSAKRKIYNYKIYTGEKDPFLNGRVTYYPYPFDEYLLKEALAKFIGKHNYQDFTSKEEDESNFIREIYEIKVNKLNNQIDVTFIGNGFMRFMIRYMMGAALAVASKKEDISFIETHLDSKSRNIISYKVEPDGLYLIDIIY